MVVSNTKKNRLNWLDVLKGVTVTMVAIHHSYLALLSMSLPYTWIDPILNSFNYHASHVRMSAFFLSGGIIFSFVKGKKTEWFFKKRFPFMVWIILIWTLISLASEELGLHLYPWKSFPFFAEGSIFLAPYGNLWFIIALLVVSYFASIVDRFQTVVKITLALCFSYTVHLCLTYFPPEQAVNVLLLKNLAYKAIPFFMLGALFFKPVLEHSRNIGGVVASTLAMLLLYAVTNYFFDSNSDYGHLLTKYIPGTFAFIGIMILLSHVSVFSKLIGKIGNCSLEIFLMHQFFIALSTAMITAGIIDISKDHEKLGVLVFPVLICIAFVLVTLPLIRPVLFQLPPTGLFEKLRQKRLGGMSAK
ncbi:acyltransferase family protein [Vibrio amylolyticus]|uniref:acyltransferase family protein n=1 Tax=Vibrio amylolyticus TaxID=2847292 RepID=UPI00354E095C